MNNVQRRPIRCLNGQWEFLLRDQWYRAESFDDAELLAWSEPMCYAVINRQVAGVGVATLLDLAAQAWLDYYQGQSSRLYLLCTALADLLRERVAEEVSPA